MISFLKIPSSLKYSILLSCLLDYTAYSLKFLYKNKPYQGIGKVCFGNLASVHIHWFGHLRLMECPITRRCNWRHSYHQDKCCNRNCNFVQNFLKVFHSFLSLFLFYQAPRRLIHLLICYFPLYTACNYRTCGRKQSQSIAYIQTIKFRKKQYSNSYN